MAEYTPPLRDMHFVLYEVFEAQRLWASLPAVAAVADRETADAILEESGKIAAEVLAPLNREADEQGCRWERGEVVTPAGFKEAYTTFVEGGWNGLGGNPAYGGLGMPKTLVAQTEEMVQGANMAFGLAPMLTAGACLAIDAHADEWLKQKYLPNLYAGTWSGAMDLTEPHAGTDLGMIRTKAEPCDDGSFRITGTKIFITWGDHDMADNVIHLVLARLPDAPPGPKGISMFLVPKRLVNEDGSLGERNGVGVGSIEHKMGINASATCVMNYDGAQGWLVGEANQGLACMFTMMNYERLVVGIQALGTAEVSYQQAVAYARERLQSRSPAGPAAADKPADPIIVHPDVRRMLMTMRAFNEGGRAFSTYVGQWLDLVKFSDASETRQQAGDMVALLTPVAKAFLSDKALDCAVLGQQVFGGHGFIREWGQEQRVRDIRITQIYEGTNGIQAMDLMGRKVALSGGRLVQLFAEDVQAFVATCGSVEGMEEFALPLQGELQALKTVTRAIVERSQSGEINVVGASAVHYLHLFGYTAYAYMWARMARVALIKAAVDEPCDDFYHAKLATARFFFRNLLPQTQALRAMLAADSDSTMAMSEDWF